MHVGFAPVFQNLGNMRSDREVYQAELNLAELAEPLGFESIWTTEHHFTDYEMIPNPIQFLSYMAGKTTHAKLGSMVVVLPWHDPLRVASDVNLLEHLSDGRTILGIGRGLARIEFEGFRVDMESSRARFVECAEAVLDGLEAGYVEYDGDHVQQPRRDLRPAPFQSFRNRTYVAAVSPESMPIVAKLGGGLLVIPQKRWEETKEDLASYEATFEEYNPGVTAPKPLLVAFCVVDEDPERAEELAHQHIGAYYASIMKHYEFGGTHWDDTEGYEYYRDFGIGVGRGGGSDSTESQVNSFVDLMPYGTPEQVVEKLAHIRSIIGYDALITHFCFGNMDYDVAEASMRLFASEVLPELKSWEAGSFGQAAPLAMNARAGS